MQTPLSTYVDFVLFVVDTTNIRWDVLEITIPAGPLLATLDIPSLNLPHDDDICAVVKSLEEMLTDKPFDTNISATLLKRNLDITNIGVDGTHYTRISGTSMGARVCLNYANILWVR